ncbi:unnamed protein product [Closterium sp. NIES-64]|nr:unnamed protein product [Closterium sp. NIES-64]
MGNCFSSVNDDDGCRASARERRRESRRKGESLQSGCLSGPPGDAASSKEMERRVAAYLAAEQQRDGQLAQLTNRGTANGFVPRSFAGPASVLCAVMDGHGRFGHTPSAPLPLALCTPPLALCTPPLAFCTPPLAFCTPPLAFCTPPLALCTPPLALVSRTVDDSLLRSNGGRPDPETGGRVEALEDEKHVQRIWLPNEMAPGLVTSRAVGDFLLKGFGVTCEPDVTVLPVDDGDEFIILATDGVWDVLSHEEAVSIVATSPSPATSAERLVTSAQEAWAAKYPKARRDDCTAVEKPARENLPKQERVGSAWH